MATHTAINPTDGGDCHGQERNDADAQRRERIAEADWHSGGAGAGCDGHQTTGSHRRLGGWHLQLGRWRSRRYLGVLPATHSVELLVAVVLDAPYSIRELGNYSLQLAELFMEFRDGRLIRLGHAADECAASARRLQRTAVLQLAHRSMDGQLGNLILIGQRAQRGNLLANGEFVGSDPPSEIIPDLSG